MMALNSIRKRGSLLLSLLGIFLLTSCQEREKSVQFSSDTFFLKIATTRGMNGYLFPHDYTLNRAKIGAGILSLGEDLQAIQQDSSYHVLLDLGKTLGGNQMELMSNAYTHPMVDALNAFKYDAWILSQDENTYQEKDLARYLSHFTGTPLFSNSPPASASFPNPSSSFVKEFSETFRVAVLSLSWREKESLSSLWEEYQREIDRIVSPYEFLVLTLDISSNTPSDKAKEELFSRFSSVPLLYLYPLPKNRILRKKENLILEIADKNNSFLLLTLELKREQGKWKTLGSGFVEQKSRQKKIPTKLQSQFAPIHDHLISVLTKPFITNLSQKRVYSLRETVGESMLLFGQADGALLPDLSLGQNRDPLLSGTLSRQKILALPLPDESVTTLKLSFSGLNLLLNRWGERFRISEKEIEKTLYGIDVERRASGFFVTSVGSKTPSKDSFVTLAMSSSLYQEFRTYFLVESTATVLNTEEKYKEKGRLPSLLESFIQYQSVAF